MLLVLKIEVVKLVLLPMLKTQMENAFQNVSLMKKDVNCVITFKLGNVLIA